MHLQNHFKIASSTARKINEDKNLQIWANTGRQHLIACLQDFIMFCTYTVTPSDITVGQETFTMDF
jgi:hypothetical protein